MRIVAILFFFSFEALSQVSQNLTDDIIDQQLSELLDNNNNSNLDVIGGDDLSIDEESDEKVDEISQEDDPINIFGFDYIQRTPKSITSTSDLPIPNDYVLSLGDTLRVILTGNKKDSFLLTIGLDGSILFPELGVVNVFGNSLFEAKKKIEDLIDVSYVGTSVSISLQEIAAKKINILGAVKNPGTYIVNPFSTISSSLAYSGGFEDYASLREVTLIRDEKKIVFDLYDLLIFGNRSNDVNIQQGDTLLVKSTNNLIEVIGDINRPFIYEYKSNETIKDVIGFALGLTNVANPKKIALRYLDKNSAKFKISEINILSDNPSMSSFSNPVELIVFPVESSPEFKIKVSGPIENQGFFDVPETGLLSDIIGQLKFTSNVNPFIGVLQRENESRLFSLLDEDTQEIHLEENSEIFFFDRNSNMLSESLKSFEEKLSDNFSESGESDESDINLIYNELKNDIGIEGGLTFNSLKLINDYKLEIKYDNFIIDFPFYGKTNALEIVKYLGLSTDGVDFNNTSYLSPLGDYSLIGSLNDLSFKAEKFNSLSLSVLNDNAIRVKISGEVPYPGTYLLSSNGTLAKLYSKAGGVKSTADGTTTIFTREAIREKNLRELEVARESINEYMLINSDINNNPNILALLNTEVDDYALGRISGDFSVNSELVESFLLEDGDEVFVPKKIRIVSVIGEVMNPSSFLYDPDMSFKSLVDLAGGYKQTALKRSAYVIRSSGEVIRSSNNIFQRSIKILPGDTIVVPPNFKSGGLIIETIAPITSILSNLAFSAAALDNLRK